MAKRFSGDDRPNARVLRRAEAYAQREIGSADDEERAQFVEEASGDIRWEDYVEHKKKTGWQLIEDYPYRTKDGITAYTIHRFQYALDPKLKQFPATYEINRVRRFGTGPLLLPYNLPELIKRSTEPIVLCEGEKAANRALKDGLLATVVHGQHWDDRIADCFADRDVYIVQDNDDAGKENTAEALARLVKVAARPRVLQLTGLARHGDLYDWLEADHNVGELLALVEHLPVHGKINIKPHQFPDERNLPPWQWVYGTHLLRGDVAVTTAMGGTGKSNLNIAEALSLATGKSSLGHSVPHVGARVLLVNMEDNSNTMNKRIAAAMRVHKLTKEAVGDQLLRVAKDEVEAAFGERFTLASKDRFGRVVRNEALIEALIAYLIEHKIDVLIVDPLTLAHEVQEKDPGEFRAAVECFGTIAMKANVAVSLFHHTRKENGNEMTVELARGALALMDTCRDMRLGEKMPKKEAERLGLTDHWRYFRLFGGKANYAPQMANSEWYRIESVTIDNNYPLPGENLSAVVTWQHPGTKALTPRPSDIEEIKKKLGEGYDREDVRSSAWAGRGVAEVMNLDHETDRDLIKKLLKKMVKDGLFKPAPRKDKSRKVHTFYVLNNDKPDEPDGQL